MSEQLARMIAHTEYTQRQTSQTPILDFDRRGQSETPGWSDMSLGTLVSLIRTQLSRKTPSAE